MREADIRPAALLNEYLRLSAEDARSFFPHADDLQGRDCPGCGTAAAGMAFVKEGFPFARCPHCATLYAARVPSAEALGAFYQDSPSQRYWAQVFFPAVAEARREKMFRPRVERLRALLDEGRAACDSIIDVGAGSGIFLEEARSLGLGRTLRAVEPSRDLAGQCRAKGFQTFEGFADQAGLDHQWRDSADLAVCFEVIEHVLSPRDLLTALARLVRPGGHVLVTGLAGTGFDIMTLGARAKAVSPPHHLNFLSRAGLEQACAAAGLRLVEFRTPGQLDVDIVANILAEDADAVTEPFLRQLLAAPDATRAAFQGFLAANGLSSHMWVLARREAV